MHHLPHLSPSPLILQSDAHSAAFRIPEKKKNRAVKVEPVFLPFSACPKRCIYCNQVASTGRSETPPDRAHAELEERLKALSTPFELAFYGGTFTLLPKKEMEAFLQSAQKYREAGLLSRLRCSTRPDALEPEVLALLQSYQMDLIELGIQSFDDRVLKQSRRGYEGKLARSACETVKEAGFSLGIQLLPGLPGSTQENFQEDVRTAVAMKPECVRLYPCQVLKGTELAEMYLRGEYEPWTLDQTVEALAEALLLFWEHDIKVIRMGLAQEPSLEVDRLAGPRHPAMGQLIISRSIFLLVLQCHGMLKAPALKLMFPHSRCSDLFGHGGCMLPDYEALGLSKEDFIPWDKDIFVLSSSDGAPGESPRKAK
jgi:histone acetyltransferase (RNA polymerase elongator complex component)